MLRNRLLGRAIAQAVSRWLPTAAARVRSQVSGTRAGFLRVLRFPLPILIPPTAPYHHRSSGAGTIGQQWPTYQVDSVVSLTSPRET
jgi:hypothetical protein